MENEVLKQTFMAQIAGQIASKLIDKNLTHEEIIDVTIKLTKGIIDGLYA